MAVAEHGGQVVSVKSHLWMLYPTAYPTTNAITAITITKMVFTIIPFTPLVHSSQQVVAWTSKKSFMKGLMWKISSKFS